MEQGGGILIDFALIKSLTEADAVSGREGEVRRLLMEGIAEPVQYDGLGSLILRRAGHGPKLMFAAHMDEVGFMVQRINLDGVLTLTALGSVAKSSLNYQSITVTTKSGAKYTGVLQTEQEDIAAHMGVYTAEAVADMGIAVGDMVTFKTITQRLGEHVYLAKALDDRIGCGILRQVYADMEKLEHPNDVYFTFTSSEETGARGGKTCADIVHPDVIFAVDVASANTPADAIKKARRLGHGYLLVCYDKSMVPNEKLLAYLKQLAEKNSLKFQENVFGGGGTDAAHAHMVDGGRLAVVLGVPLQFCHGSLSMCHTDDVSGLQALIMHIIKALDADTLKAIQSFS
jgi:putative aminopeptidase FrvX